MARKAGDVVRWLHIHVWVSESFNFQCCWLLVSCHASKMRVECRTIALVEDLGSCLALEDIDELHGAVKCCRYFLPSSLLSFA